MPQAVYVDTDSFIYDIKTNDFYKDITNEIEASFDMSGYNCSCPFPMGMNKKVIGLMKNKLGRRIMTKFMALIPKLYAFKMLSGSGDRR